MDEEETETTFEADPPECPCCTGAGMPLGCLGRMTWYRCRRCGTDFNDKGEVKG